MLSPLLLLMGPLAVAHGHFHNWNSGILLSTKVCTVIIMWFYLKLGKSKLQKLYCQTRSSTNIFVNFTLTASGWQPATIVQHLSQNSSSKKKNVCFLKSLQLAKSLNLIQAFAFCVKLVNKHLFSFFSEETILSENFLNNLDSHVTYAVSLQVEVFTCGFVKLLSSNIASMFTKSFL